MASISQARALAGVKAFTGVRPRVAAPVANGSKYFMKKKDSYMVEVEVGEDEPEDVAVRRYMKLVMQSRVVEKLRARRTKESKIEEYKRRLRERIEMRKAGVVEPTYEELYSNDPDSKPFDDFFQKRDEEDPEGAYDGLAGDDIFNSFGQGAGYTDRAWGAYAAPVGGNYAQGGANWQGGYM